MSNITLRQGFAPATLDEAMRFSDMLASSSMVPKAYQNKPQDILVCVQWGYEMGLAPMQALQNIAVINGKPSVYGDAVMALVQASQACEGVEEFFEGEGTPNPIAVCIAHRKGRKPVTAKFSVEDAKRAGLWGKQGPWQAYPKRMLQMRARGFALRDQFADILKGLITVEEAHDEMEEEKPEMMHKAPSRNPLDAIALLKPKMTNPERQPQSEPEPEPEPEPMIEDVVLPGTEVVDIPTVAEIGNFNDIEGFHLKLPGKTNSHTIFKKMSEWQEAYEDMAERVATSQSIEPRERMTKLRELKEVNNETLEKIPQLERLVHTAAYSKRLRALGASMD